MAISVIEFLGKKVILVVRSRTKATEFSLVVVPQPPYSPELSPCDFSFSVPKLKFHLKGRHFRKVKNIEKAVTDQLKAIPISDFQRCYEEWEQRFRRCVAFQGN